MIYITSDEVNKILKNKGYYFYNDSFKQMKDKYNLIDSEGYKYYTSLQGLCYNNGLPRAFHKDNIYSIENIKHYIIKNNIKAELLSTEYDNSRILLDFKCECGTVFCKSWGKFKAGQTRCNHCANEIVQKNKTYDKDYVKLLIKDKPYKMIEGSFSMLSEGFDAVTNDGYILKIHRSNILTNDEPEIFHPNNPHTIENINNYFKINYDGEYKCLEKNYVNNSTPMEFIHIPCGNKFYDTFANMKLRDVYHNGEKRRRLCSKCQSPKTESYHAIVLKQIFKHEMDGTVLEDKSCINPITNRILPTDIVNHNNKIAIEVQSAYHDNKYQSLKDSIKRKYWIDKGYNFYSPDIRDYTILEMIQIFFPNIKQIPDYVDYKYEDSEKFYIAQKYIDLGYNRTKTASLLGVSVSSLYYWNKDGKINLTTD